MSGGRENALDRTAAVPGSDAFAAAGGVPSDGVVGALPRCALAEAGGDVCSRWSWPSSCWMVRIWLGAGALVPLSQDRITCSGTSRSRATSRQLLPLVNLYWLSHWVPWFCMIPFDRRQALPGKAVS